MILGQIAWSDCFVFVLALIPHLLLDVPLVELIQCALITLPFLLLFMPVRLVHERYILPFEQRSRVVQHATLFQDLVIRCVRFAFSNISATIGRVFFSKGVSVPFLRYRMLRHGILRSPIKWKDIQIGKSKAVYIVEDESQAPGVLIYYCHGGGFTMGSPYFYMEFLMAWVTLLKQAGYSNPAVLALDYTLVPDATYPTQLQQTLEGYKHALSLVARADRVIVSGDSAGGTLVLSLLLCLATVNTQRVQLPGLAVLISPWTSLISPENRDTPSDYLNAETLEKYARLYVGKLASANDTMVSPGDCHELGIWRRASPSKGMLFIYGAEEVFAPDIKTVVARLSKAGVKVEAFEEPKWIHAWPVVKLFLCNEERDRLSGLSHIVRFVLDRIEV